MLSLGLGLVSFGLGLEPCGLVNITVIFIYQAGSNINNISNRRLNYKRSIKYYNCLRNWQRKTEIQRNINLSLFEGGTAPKVIDPLADTTSKAQAETVLRCKIDSGEPAASIHWYRDSKELYHGKRYHLSYIEDVATLRFADSVVADAGAYRCEAVNKLARVNTDCRLTVECKPVHRYRGLKVIIIIIIMIITGSDARWVAG